MGGDKPRPSRYNAGTLPSKVTNIIEEEITGNNKYQNTVPSTLTSGGGSTCFSQDPRVTRAHLLNHGGVSGCDFTDH